MTSPRPYVAAAAAAVLAALYFVPSATASPVHAAPAPNSAHAVAQTSSQHAGLADTGSIDTKPYMIGGAAFLVAGAGLVVTASRRARQAL